MASTATFNTWTVDVTHRLHVSYRRYTLVQRRYNFIGRFNFKTTVTVQSSKSDICAPCGVRQPPTPPTGPLRPQDQDAKSAILPCHIILLHLSGSGVKYSSKSDPNCDLVLFDAILSREWWCVPIRERGAAPRKESFDGQRTGTGRFPRR